MSDVTFLVEALLSLKPNCQWTIEGEEVSGLIWLDENSEKPTDEELYDKIAELRAAKPMRLLREERNKRLQETDWWAAGDRIDSMTNEQKIYRKQLRDLPSIFSSSSLTLEENTSGYPGTFLLETSDMGLSAGPSLELNENGQLSNVTWPTKPE